ncbi:hypothetical protein pb186bvf_000623 [Paramecium bursaria]
MNLQIKTEMLQMLIFQGQNLLFKQFLLNMEIRNSQPQVTKIIFLSIKYYNQIFYINRQNLSKIIKSLNNIDVVYLEIKHSGIVCGYSQNKVYFG